MDGQQTREVRLQRLERDEQDLSGRMGVNARTADSPPASRVDWDAMPPFSQATPLPSPIVKKSLTPEEHENLVAQQLLLWRQQVQLYQHQQQKPPLTAAQDTVVAARYCAETISRDASASGPRAITATAMRAGMGREQPSSELLRQVRADGGRPLETEGCTPSKDATETSKCSVGTEQIKQDTVESEPPARGGSDTAEPRASSRHNQDPPTPATTGATPDASPQRGILRRKGRRLGSGGSHDSEEAITTSCAGATSDQSRPSKKRVRFSSETETEKGRAEPPPPPRRQRLVSVPFQVIRAQLELHADLQSQVNQMRIEMHRHRLEQRRISAGLMDCIKVLELKTAELSRELRGDFS